LSTAFQDARTRAPPSAAYAPTIRNIFIQIAQDGGHFVGKGARIYGLLILFA
jgi:hypothetical protein